VEDFRWVAEPAGNNSGAPSATLNLQFASGGKAPAETGLSINPMGQISFAAGQSFPGLGTVTSVASGAGLTGGPITGWPGGLNWMSNAIDIINFHFYVTNEQPENDFPADSTNNWIVAAKGVMSASDLAKPLWSGEGSCGAGGNPNHIWSDAYSMAGFAIRHSALLWSAGVTKDFWFQYETSSDPYCPLFSSTGSLLPAGLAWNSGYRWLVGSTPTNNPFCSASGTIWACPLTETNGRAAELVWDAQYGPGGTTSPSICSTALVPTICGSTTYTVPAPYSGGDWVDVTGTSHPFSPTVTIGAVPIFLEGTSGVNVKGKVQLTGNVHM
jgi:hypothetical protein